eukprot:snap_masked-scaffold_9-processed-gene-8.45-mRNA-1 protein AED:1.00 eAED:1.00 QI:0/-1/0/0/-1/1/1/0/161
MERDYIALSLPRTGFAGYWTVPRRFSTLEVLVTDKTLLDTPRSGTTLSAYLKLLLKEKVSEHFKVDVRIEACSSLIGTRIKYRFTKVKKQKIKNPKTTVWKEQIVFLLAKEFQNYGYSFSCSYFAGMEGEKFFLSKKDERAKPVVDVYPISLHNEDIQKEI